MAEMILVEPFDLAFGGAAPNLVVSRGSGGANLLTNDPREVWQDSALGTVTMDIDFGATRSWDTIALINTNGVSTTTLSVTGGSTLTAATYQAATVLRTPSEDVADATGPGFFYSSTTISGRYIRLTLSNPSGVPLSAGRLIVGKSWKPSYPRETGAGRPPIDTGSRQRLDDGSLAVASGRLVSGFKWVFADLAPGDLKALWGILRRRRTTEPVLLVEDPLPAEAEGVHYGTFTELESYERRDAEKSRWALNFEDWV